jgi:hypothetical protein
MGDVYTQPVKFMSAREVKGWAIVDTLRGQILWDTFRVTKSPLYRWAEKMGLKPKNRWKIKRAVLTVAS